MYAFPGLLLLITLHLGPVLPVCRAPDRWRAAHDAGSYLRSVQDDAVVQASGEDGLAADGAPGFGGRRELRRRCVGSVLPVSFRCAAAVGPVGGLLVSLLGGQALFTVNVPLAQPALVVVNRWSRPIPDGK